MMLDPTREDFRVAWRNVRIKAKHDRSEPADVLPPTTLTARVAAEQAFKGLQRARDIAYMLNRPMDEVCEYLERGSLP